MRRSRSLVASALALALASVLTAGCGAGDAEPATSATSPSQSSSQSSAQSSAQPSSSPSPSPTETRSTEAATESPRGTAITTAGSEFGEILWGPNRQVVYMWESEPTSKPQCYADCAALWPPVLTTGEPRAKGAVAEGLLGTTKRRDGSVQVTYDGHPLYYYAHEGPGEVECHDIATHGGLWWVVTPAGDRVT